MRTIIQALVALLILSVPICARQAAPPAQANMEATARRLVDAMAAGDFIGATANFNSTMKGALTPAQLESAWQSLITQAGAFKQVVRSRRERVQQYDVVFVTMRFANADIDAKVAIDSEGKVGGLFFAPASAPPPDTAAPTSSSAPPYAKPTLFTERDVVVGSGEWALPGTLTMPIEPDSRSVPAVVLVHGSGPNDRDESVKGSKPFRDLAWGLASRGIAVLRYDKRTLVHGAKIASMTNAFTVKDETVDDALAAVALLRATPGIDAKRIVVVGHSLGGTLVPRIGARDRNIAGFVVMAGATRPIEDLIVEQYGYIFSLDGVVSAEERAELEKTKADAARVKRASQLAAGELVFGGPKSYWVDLAGYDPADAAKSLTQPLLILQGGRDYQVTMKDYDGWKQALGARPGVEFKLYPDLNHLFITGTGRSEPKEYDTPGFVAEPVVADIVRWVTSIPTTATPARAEEPAAAADPYAYEPPAGWKPERIPFPLGFAPSLAYTGYEQLHFAPGMFDTASENYFTYVFLWWVDGEPEVTETTLARDLVAYYRGLSAAVGEPKGMKFDLTKVEATVVAVADAKSDEVTAPGPSTRRFTGKLNTFDPFTKGQALTLEVEIAAWRCEQEKRTVVFFCVSPKPRDTAAQWAPMRTALASFRCRR